ncbi:hypothetical protein J2786_000508 [Chryseobacterium vietnamense]|uniref:Uncharacterized protein n=1 Tax=Chryseobacterium vietnamense TaxID=866785 RepID=A0ACC6J316_9FLAO|nr:MULTISPECIES: DUF3408 domain-containing protein [Chryseobacterium]MDR6457415.1 hypothetical protein [Chryseobacterium vietnamense]
MNKENLHDQSNENAAYVKKGTSNKPNGQSQELADSTIAVTDDEYLKHAMAAEMPKETQPIKSQSFVSGNRRSKSSGLTEKEYFEIFFKIPKQNASKGRTVYIRPEFHQKFLKLIAGLEIDRLTMYAYLDNIIDYHFIHFEELIHKIYQDRNKPLF